MSARSRVFVTGLILVGVLAASATCEPLSAPLTPAPVGVQQAGTVSLSSGSAVVVACATCAPGLTGTLTATAEPTATPGLGQAGSEYIILDGVTVVDGRDMGLQPGDRLLIPSTRTGHLKFVNLRGGPDRPIVITNEGGQVTLADSHWIGVDFQRSEWFRFSGSGEPGVEYGFVIRDFSNAGIFAWRGSRNFEIDHVEVSGVSMAGVRILTDREDVPEGWTQTGVRVHHTYIHDTDGEGYYIGHRADTGRAPLDGLEMSFNRVERAGTDGLQVRQAWNCDIHDNYVHTAGVRLIETEEERPNQAGAGLIIGPDSTGDWYNNVIVNANRGVMLHRSGSDVEIYNNLIVDAGQIYGELRGEGGIRWFGGAGARIYNNTIVGSFAYDVRGDAASSGVIYNNLIVGVAPIGIRAGGAMVHHNVEADAAEGIFMNPAMGDYRLLAGSPAIDAGVEPCPALDLAGQQRVGACDVGAFEYGR